MSLAEKITVGILVWTWMGLLGSIILFAIRQHQDSNPTYKSIKHIDYISYMKGVVFALVLGPLTGFFIGILAREGDE